MKNFGKAVNQDQKELRTALTKITERSPEFPGGKPTNYWIDVAQRTHKAMYDSCEDKDRARGMVQDLISSNCNLGELLRWDEYREKSAVNC